jgi:hypothetical protein
MNIATGGSGGMSLRADSLRPKTPDVYQPGRRLHRFAHTTIRRNDLYVLTHPELNEHIKDRMNRIFESGRSQPFDPQGDSLQD